MIVKPSDARDAKWHISLDDGTTEIGFKTCDSRGNPDPRGVVSNPYPQYASQLRQGRSKHADRVPPFTDIALSDLSGGRGNLHYDEDKSRYWDGKRMDTRMEGRAILGPQETYIPGIRDFDENWPGDLSWTSLYSGGTTSKAIDLTPGASYSAQSVMVILRKTGSPTGDVQVELLNAVGAQLKTKSLTIGTDILTGYESERVEFVFSTVQALTAGGSYQVRVTYSGGDSDDHVKLGVDSSDDPFYRVLDDTGDFDVMFFEYKEQLYLVTKPNDGSVSKVYMQGDRGAADSNSGALGTLVDATKSWTVDEWAGDVVAVIGGPGRLEEQNWRTIASNTSDTLTLDENWTVTHTTDTEYVILSDTWQLMQTLTARALDVEVALDKVYFAFGLPEGSPPDVYDRYSRRYRAYNNDGVWTEEIEQEDNDGSGSEKFLSIYNATWQYPNPFHYDLWKVEGDEDTTTRISRFTVPRTWGDLVYPLGELCRNDRAWVEADDGYSNVVLRPYFSGSWSQVTDSFTTGKFAHWKLDAPLDVRGAEAICLRCTVVPTATGTNYEDDGDIRMVLADSDGIEDEYNFSGNVDGYYNQIMFLDDTSAATADQSDITDIYLKINSDEGGVIISITGPLYLTGDRNLPYQRYQEFPEGLKVNNLIRYLGAAGEMVEQPWMLTTKGVYSIARGAITSLNLGEMEELVHPDNGKGATVSDVYLYFNMGETIQRYYSGQLDNVGPDVGYGLPENRRGIPISLASYPGHVFACIDADDGYSSIMTRRNHGWHELYRAPEGKRIRQIHIVGMSNEPDRLYFSEGADVGYIQLALNPETEEDYEYTYEGVVETGKIYAGGLRETDKYFDSITLITEDLDANTTCEIDYKTSGNTTYQSLGTVYNTSPKQEVDLPDNTTGRWIQFRMRFYSEDNAVTPVQVSAVLDALERYEHKDTFTYTVRLDSGASRDFMGREATNDGFAKWTQLKTWMNSANKLTLYSVSEFEHDTDVFIEPSQTRVVHHHWDDASNNEMRVIQLTLIEK